MSIDCCLSYSMNSFGINVLQEHEENLVKNSDNVFEHFRIDFVNVRIAQHENLLLHCLKLNYNELQGRRKSV